MFAILPFVSLLLGMAIMVAITKLAARLYKRARLSWGHATGYALLLLVGMSILAALNQLGGAVSPWPLLLSASLAFQSLLGGWYLGSYGRTSDGTQLAFARGAILGLINNALILSLAVIAVLARLAVSA